MKKTRRFLFEFFSWASPSIPLEVFDSLQGFDDFLLGLATKDAIGDGGIISNMIPLEHGRLPQPFFKAVGKLVTCHIRPIAVGEAETDAHTTSVRRRAHQVFLEDYQEQGHFDHLDESLLSLRL